MFGIEIDWESWLPDWPDWLGGGDNEPTWSDPDRPAPAGGKYRNLPAYLALAGVAYLIWRRV